MIEIVVWKDVVGHEGIYEVSSDGHIRNIKTGKILAKSMMAYRYYKADLWKNGKRRQTSLHRIVCEAFHGDGAGKEVNHINGDRVDNRASNLEWVTHSQNVNHNCYVLGNVVKKVECTSVATGSVCIFPSVWEACRILNLNNGSVHDCLRGKREDVFGWRIAYAAPVQSGYVPLTDEQIDVITTKQWGSRAVMPACRAYARAIEKAVRGEKP